MNSPSHPVVVVFFVGGGGMGVRIGWGGVGWSGGVHSEICGR